MKTALGIFFFDIEIVPPKECKNAFVRLPFQASVSAVGTKPFMDSSTERRFQMFKDYFGLARVVAGFHAENELQKASSSNSEKAEDKSFKARRQMRLSAPPVSLSPPTSPIQVSPPPTSPVRISPIQTSTNEEEVAQATRNARGLHEEITADTHGSVGANKAIATTDPTQQCLRMKMSEVNLLKDKIFIDEVKCPICIKEYDKNSINDTISSCNTDYHSTWTVNAKTCPACRAVEDVDCMFAKIKIVMPYMTISDMIQHILNNGTMDDLSNFNNVLNHDV
eukprot:gene9937-18546_t